MMTLQDSNVLVEASTALQAGDLETGEKLLDRVIAIQPKNAAALDLKAQILRNRGEYEAAESHSRRALQLAPKSCFALTLAGILLLRGSFAAAKFYFERILDKLPNEPRSLTGLGQIAVKDGDIDLAIEYFGRALYDDPTNSNLAIEWSKLLPIGDLSKGLSALNFAKPGKSSAIREQIAYLAHLIPYSEQANRAQTGKMPYHQDCIDNPIFQFEVRQVTDYLKLAEEVLSQTPNDKTALTAKAMALFCLGKRQDAGPVFAILARNRKNSIYDNVIFDHTFFDDLRGLAESNLIEALSSIIEVKCCSFTSGSVLYLACNFGYFLDFAMPFLLSIDTVAPSSQVHLHVMDVTSIEIGHVSQFCETLRNVTVAITAENSGIAKNEITEARCYYHAIRFVRLYHFLMRYGRPIWMMDVDALLHRDISPLFDLAQNADVAFRIRPGRWEPWNQFNASVICVSPTLRGLEYSRYIACFIVHFFQRKQLRWGIDQLAMYLVYQHLKRNNCEPTVYPLNDKEVDNHFHEDGFIWCNSGRGKFVQLKRMRNHHEMPKDKQMLPYLGALQFYRARLLENGFPTVVNSEAF